MDISLIFGIISKFFNNWICTTYECVAVFNENGIGGGVGIGDKNLNNILLNVFPNPVSNNVTLNFSLPDKTHAEILLLNQNGQIISNEFSGIVDKGVQNININTEHLHSGIYFVSIKTSDNNQVHKFIKM